MGLFPKVSGFFGAATKGTVGSIAKNFTQAVKGTVPGISSIGNSIGTILGGRAKQKLLSLGAKTFPGIFDNKYIGPIANQIWGSLFVSSSANFDEMQARRDPIMNIDWLIRMPPLDFDKINHHVEEISFSATGFDNAPYQRAGRTINLAAGRSTPSFSVTFYLDNEMMAVQYVEAWKNLVGNPDGTFNYPSQYRQTVAVNVVDQAGNYTGTFLLANCFPIGPYQIQLASGSAERQRLVQEFSSDQVLFVPYGATVAVGDPTTVG